MQWREPSQLPKTVTALGMVSLLMAGSSQMTHSLLPLFLVTVMGATPTTVGLIEGLAEATNSILRVLSGGVSDRLGRRKPLIVLGYSLSALVKPAFPLAGDVTTILLARVLDRTGKGIRDAPRDALLADRVPEHRRGSGFGLRISLFTIGSCLGPLIAAAAMAQSGGDFRLVFWIAVLPAALSAVVLVTKVEESSLHHLPAISRPDWKAFTRLPTAFWRVMGIGCLIALSRFSQVFLLLKAKDVGVATALVPVYLALVAGLVVLGTCHVLMATGGSGTLVAVGAILWGLQLGIIDSLMAASVADSAPSELRGTAFGVYHLGIGVASLLASTLAGALWVVGGAALTYGVGAIFASLAVLALLAGQSILARSD